MTREAQEPPSTVRLYAGDGATPAVLVCRIGERRVRGLSNAYTLEYGPIVGAANGAGVEAVLRLATAIAADAPRCEAIELAALDPADPGFAALRDGFRAAHLIVKPVFDCGTWYETTGGLDFPRYFAGRPGALKNTYRRKLKAATQHRLSYEFSDGAGADIEHMIAAYDTIYLRSWKESERFPGFMPALIRLAHGLGALRMGVLSIDDAPAAAQFWLVWRGRAVIYKLAHDERFERLSPGTLLTMRMVERVLEQDRPREINFGRGDDPYKKLWLPRRRERWGLVAANPRTLQGGYLSARILAGRVRDRLVGSPA